MEKTKKITYRHAIQELIRETWNSYDRAGSFRDCATSDEKEYWNTYRGKMYEAAQILSQLDNTMPDHIANRSL